MIIMLSAIPNKSYQVPSGNVYVANGFGIITPCVASVADQLSLTAMGCALLNPNPTNLLGKLLGANFDVTTDQAIPLNNAVRFNITSIIVLNTSVNGMSTAEGGLYTAATKGGTAIVANTQAYTGLTNAATQLALTLAVPTLVLPAASLLYFSLTTPQGVAASADIYVFGNTYP